jgi:hypothetical protein
MAIRVAVGDPRAISVTFPAAATGAVSVSIDSARLGTTLGPFTAPLVSGSTYAYMLTPDQVAAVDELRLRFTATVAGVVRELREVVPVAGNHYFTVAEARTLGPIESTFTDAQIESQRMAVEDQIEANCDTSFVARFVSEKANGGRQGFVRLTEPYVLDLVSVFEDETDVTTEVRLDGRYVWRGSGIADHAQWSPGHRNIDLRYEAAFQTYPPEDLRRKSIEATRYGLLREKRTGLPPQAIMVGTEMGTLRLALAGLRQPFGLPEVDAVVLEWARRVGAGL